MTEEEWKSNFAGYCGEGSTDTRDKYYMPLPVWTGGNVYFNGAKPCDIEEDYVVDNEHEVELKLVEKDGVYTVESELYKYLPKCNIISSDTLGIAFEPEERFEAPDGSDIILDTDKNAERETENILKNFPTIQTKIK